jgi:hypothetical protein
VSHDKVKTGKPAVDVPGGQGVPMAVSPAQRREMVAVAAYFRAERRGFAPGGAERDWMEAEDEIDALLARMSSSGTTREEFDRVGLRNALRLWAHGS